MHPGTHTSRNKCEQMRAGTESSDNPSNQKTPMKHV
jgi:hypothetical protein